MGKSKGKHNKQKASIEDKYEIVEEFGEGGNAIVYKVKDKASQNEYALKALYNFEDEKKSRFIDEITTINELVTKRISGVLPIYDSSQEHYWYTMPIAIKIMDYIKDNNDISTIINGTIDIANSLINIHALNFAHRDVKPDNIYFFNGRFTLGDFGLVEMPDNDHNKTRSDKGLGAIFTIAPEMKRSPKASDGKKADVYSLAKTLWMFLTLDEKGFDGQYNFLDDSHRLHSNSQYSNTHLVEIDELLSIATDNDPNKRPTMVEFREALTKWKATFKNQELSQVSDWNFLTKNIFREYTPRSTEFTNINDIVRVLNIISKSPAMNHFLYATGGGLDLEKAELANEKDCIYIYTDGFCQVAKPKRLLYESFPDVRWNYFLMDLDSLYPIVGTEVSEYEEHVVEDEPGHYVSAIDACYKVYDYDSGVPLPEGFKVVDRLLKGKFLIVLKQGPYNHITATYDGRHNDCSSVDFRKYIEYLSSVVSKEVANGKDDNSVLQHYGRNPFKKSIEYIPEVHDTTIQTLPCAQPYIKEHFSKWDFSKITGKKTVHSNDIIRFYFRFDLADENDFLTNLLSDVKPLLLSSSGQIKEYDSELKETDAYYTTNREEALEIESKLNDEISRLCQNYDYNTFTSSKFGICWVRTGKPIHLFTREEIEKQMRAADDRKGNKLVIDENGYAQILPIETRGNLYPVCHELYGARNNYVGKYSDLPTLNEDYRESLVAWKTHLEKGCYVYCDDVSHYDESNDELIEEIKKITLEMKSND